MLVTNDTYAAAMEHLTKCDELFVDTETDGLHPFRGNKLGGISIDGGLLSFYFPFRHGTGENLPLSKLSGDIAALIRSKPSTGFNYGFDLKFLYKDGMQYPDRVSDVQIAAHLMNENEPSLALKKLADRYVEPGSSLEDKKLAELLASKGLGKGDMCQLPPELVAPYACKDVELTRKLRDFYIPHMRHWEVYDLWLDCNRFLTAITHMETRGMKLDLALMQKYSEEASFHEQQSLQQLYKVAGYEINPRSAKQLQKWLGLKSTAAEILETMEDRPGVKELLTYRAWQKVNANYYRKFFEVKDERGCLHPQLNITGTDTGRLSCKDPNLQAIPRQTDIYKVKDVFVAQDDHELVEGDYSQAEIRVASHYGNEENMKEKLARGADIHTETAEEINIPRDPAKRLNFSVIYGIGKRTLAQNLKIKEKTAKEYLDKYHAKYPGFRRLYNRSEMIAEQRGYIRLFTGRLRHFNTPDAYTHKASSNLVQGTVSEMVRVAINRLHHELKVPMLLTVHDSILFEIEKNRVKELIPEIRRIMEDAPWCSVKMPVDFKRGTSWGKAVKV